MASHPTQWQISKALKNVGKEEANLFALPLPSQSPTAWFFDPGWQIHLYNPFYPAALYRILILVLLTIVLTLKEFFTHFRQPRAPWFMHLCFNSCLCPSVGIRIFHFGLTGQYPVNFGFKWLDWSIMVKSNWLKIISFCAVHHFKGSGRRFCN